MRKHAKTKTQISFAVTAKLISAFVFATRIVQCLYFLNLKFHASRHLLWLLSPVYVGPGLKPRRPLFSKRGSFINWMYTQLIELVLSGLTISYHDSYYPPVPDEDLRWCLLHLEKKVFYSH